MAVFFCKKQLADYKGSLVELPRVSAMLVVRFTLSNNDIYTTKAYTMKTTLNKAPPAIESQPIYTCAPLFRIEQPSFKTKNRPHKKQKL